MEAPLNRRLVFVGGAVLVALIAVTAFLYFGRSHSLAGTVISPPWPAPDINLTDHAGRPFSMSQQRGRVVLLYFGYVNCPDECPLTMAHLKLAVGLLGSNARDVQVLMVSTDPVRDTPAALGEFMAKFDPSFLGLTGSPADLQKAWKDYGVTVENGGETHSTFIYVIDTAGSVRETFLPDSDPAAIAADVGLLLQAR
jgi:protein SCO1/2